MEALRSILCAQLHPVQHKPEVDLNNQDHFYSQAHHISIDTENGRFAQSKKMLTAQYRDSRNLGLFAYGVLVPHPVWRLLIRMGDFHGAELELSDAAVLASSTGSSSTELTLIFFGPLYIGSEQNPRVGGL